jgi:hypothetical protein
MTDKKQPGPEWIERGLGTDLAAAVSGASGGIAGVATAKIIGAVKKPKDDEPKKD